jgi:HPt (histidine-containing phosphotransfer) domain-containing protein
MSSSQEANTPPPMPDFDPRPFSGSPPSAAQSRARAIEALSGEESLLLMLAPQFRESAASQVESLKTALAKADAPDVRHWSHTLKGTLVTVGAKDTAALAAAIERTAREGILDGVQVPFERLCAEVPVLIEQLTAQA